jgi:hypothetical protein
VLIVIDTFVMKTSFSVSQGGLRSINGMIVPLPLGVNRVEPSTDKNRQRSYKDGSKTFHVHQYDYIYHHEGSILAWIEHKLDCKRLMEAITDIKTVDHFHLFWSESLYGQALVDYASAVNKAKGNKEEGDDSALLRCRTRRRSISLTLWRDLSWPPADCH